MGEARLEFSFRGKVVEDCGSIMKTKVIIWPEAPGTPAGIPAMEARNEEYFPSLCKHEGLPGTKLDHSRPVGSP